MRLFRSIAPALLAVLAVPAGAGPIAAHGEQKIERGEEQERHEIARILAADNVDASRLSAREVATAIAAIPRGEAPEEFWQAYQAHVLAWESKAAAEDWIRSLKSSDRIAIERALGDLIAAEEAISATFARIRQIATDYGVAMPIPPAEAANTV